MAEGRNVPDSEFSLGDRHPLTLSATAYIESLADQRLRTLEATFERLVVERAECVANVLDYDQRMANIAARRDAIRKWKESLHG